MSSFFTQHVSSNTGDSFCQKKSPDSHIQYKDVFIYVPFIHEVEKIIQVPVILYDPDNVSHPTHFSSSSHLRKDSEPIQRPNDFGKILNTTQEFFDNHQESISKRHVFRRNTNNSTENQPLHRSLIQMFSYNKLVSQLYRQNTIHLPLGYFTVSDYKRLQSLKNKRFVSTRLRYFSGLLFFPYF
ncbi:uncharacterized protein LOC128883901 isoform X2 [Hylaeus volcanicus]|uniref:uncharacterized protein LOC128883901 isoform X2 n=1 Tax=Hylaeus volcanicus TaxID=313075 RepID=UPI0023B8176D|nr:uncharacterized protein LOC128883901 isoform X2 [Hylaeus volcanicus]